MTPLMSDRSYDQNYLNAYNQRVATTGGRLNVGEFNQQYDFNQGVAGLPAKQRIPLQYQMQQDQAQAARQATQDTQASSNENWNRWREWQLMESQQKAAQYQMQRDLAQDKIGDWRNRFSYNNEVWNRQMEMNRLKAQQDAATSRAVVNPYDVAADIGKGFGVPNIMNAIQEMDLNQDFTKDYKYNFTDSFGNAQTRQLTPQAYQCLRAVNEMANPGIYKQRARAGAVESIGMHGADPGSEGSIGALQEIADRKRQIELRRKAEEDLAARNAAASQWRVPHKAAQGAYYTPLEF